MGLKDDFNNWPLGRQLQILFVTAGFMLAAILVVVTKFQLDWLRDKVSENSSTAVMDRVLSQMKALGKIEGKYLESDLKRYITFAHEQKLIDQVFNDFNTPNYTSNPFKEDIAYKDTTAPVDGTLDHGVYFSSRSLSSAGMRLVSIESCFNRIYPFELINEFFGLYQGYEIDEIIYSYPGYTYSVLTFTPLVREWYYKASDDKYSVVITEPYMDSNSGSWIITASEAILDNNNNLYGVAAVDIALDTLTTKTKNIVILKNGFAMLVSSGGMILTIPKAWKASIGAATIRIFDSTYTGITKDQWTAIKNSITDSIHIFNDANNSAFYLIKHDIAPFYNKENATHYLLLCIPLSDIENQKVNIDNSFEYTYNILFWVTVSIGITIFLTITVLVSVFSRQSANQLRMIEKVFGKTVRRGLFTRITRGIDYKKLENYSKGIEDLINACKDKLNKIDDIEQSFINYNWGLTRPNDYLLYNEWCDRIYPFNFYSDNETPWKALLPGLTKALV